MVKNILYIIMGLMWVILVANIIYIHHPSLGKIAMVGCIVLYIVLNKIDPNHKLRSGYDGNN